MRHWMIFLFLIILLCGCSAAEPEPAVSIPPATDAAVRTAPPPETTQPADPLQSLLDAMTLEEKVGQLFLARCPGNSAPEDLETYHLGGYILFGQDTAGQTPESLARTISSWQAAAPIPLFIAVDEEGGTVCRISSESTFRHSCFPSPRDAYSQGGMEQLLAVESEKAGLLSSLGINVNMGPVCDIATIPEAFMYKRSLGQSPEETGRFIRSTVQIIKNHRLGSVLKHFPGYGNNADTHTGAVTDNRTLSELENADLLPFAAGIDAGCDAILISHTVITAMDDSLPASLSPAVHDYLRNTMGFNGVIVTDDLIMDAISDTFGPEESAVLAVLAGNDLLCSTEYNVQYPAVLDAVRSGRIPMEQLEASVWRILQWKKNLGLIF